MATYHFDVDGHPVPQPRTRMARLRTGGIRNYDPGTSNTWKSLVAMAAKKVRPAAPLRGPLHFDADFRFQRPKSHYHKSGDLRPGAPAWVSSCGRNDLDNLMKAPTDALTQIGFWEDDGQIAIARLQKRYVAPGERPGASFVVMEVE